MKYVKVSAVLVLILISFNSFAQLKNFPILVCKDDATIIKYLDSLNAAEGNPAYKVVKNTSDAGNLILTETFGIDDERFYTCYDLILKFTKMGPFSVCVREDVLSTGKYATPNIDYIKNNFAEKISDSKWEMKGPPELPIFIDATIKMSGDNFCHIQYSLKDLDR
jgi:hypothetical protein